MPDVLTLHTQEDVNLAHALWHARDCKEEHALAIQGCARAKALRAHAHGCTSETCPVAHCSTSRDLLKHWINDCQGERCGFCQPLRKCRKKATVALQLVFAPAGCQPVPPIGAYEAQLGVGVNTSTAPEASKLDASYFSVEALSCSALSTRSAEDIARHQHATYRDALWENLLLPVLNHLKNDKAHNAGAFNSPATEAQTPGYKDVIKHPMDLGTIRDRGCRRQYENAAAFEADVSLVFSNAMQFNPHPHELHQRAEALLSQFATRWSKMVAADAKRKAICSECVQSEEQHCCNMCGYQCLRLKPETYSCHTCGMHLDSKQYLYITPDASQCWSNAQQPAEPVRAGATEAAVAAAEGVAVAEAGGLAVRRGRTGAVTVKEAAAGGALLEEIPAGGREALVAGAAIPARRAAPPERTGAAAAAAEGGRAANSSTGAAAVTGGRTEEARGEAAAEAHNLPGGMAAGGRRAMVRGAATSARATPAAARSVEIERAPAGMRTAAAARAGAGGRRIGGRKGGSRRGAACGPRSGGGTTCGSSSSTHSGGERRCAGGAKASCGAHAHIGGGGRSGGKGRRVFAEAGGGRRRSAGGACDGGRTRAGSVAHRLSAWVCSCGGGEHNVLSAYLVARVRARCAQALQDYQLRHGAAAALDPKDLSVRVLASGTATHNVPLIIQRAFRAGPGADLPPAIDYIIKAIGLFALIDGVDVCVLMVYVYEYGPNAPSCNAKSVYVAYVDSVEYLYPGAKSTINYIWWLRPAHQKMPSAAQLRGYYNRVFQRCDEYGTTVASARINLYAARFAAIEQAVVQGGGASVGGVGSEAAAGGGQGGADWRTVAPVLIEGDCWPSELMRLVRQRGEERRKDRAAAAGSYAEELRALLLRLCAVVKEKQESLFVVPLARTGQPLEDASGEDMWQAAVRTYRGSAEFRVDAGGCVDPDAPLPGGPVDAQDTCLQALTWLGFQTDTLRLAKYTTALLLYHCHRVERNSLNPRCNQCSSHHPICNTLGYRCTPCAYQVSLTHVKLEVEVGNT
ncbi:hypothetical protein JKP88DRAFT_337735 [Tribonema minus]|uniref:histone acetyltransferase n=1 Tax=Tribonema minus TaxID=303371 RepID=A0A836C8R2_9STRA|nr:hypothetical protein JKP88DRAFT_337735 [Tribonema minus]